MSRFFGKAQHTAFIVPDIDREIERLLASGFGPFYVMRQIPARARYRGERHDVVATVAFAFSGTHYEFIEVNGDTPSVYREFLDRHPEGGLHHIAYYCDDYDKALALAAAQGTAFEVVQEIITPEGVPVEIYLEPKGAEDTVFMQLMLPSPELLKFFYGIEQATKDWDGTQPVRDALALMPSHFRVPIEATEHA